MREKHLGLEDAAHELRAAGIATGRDYHALSTDDSFWLAVSRFWRRPPPRRRHAPGRRR